MALPLPLLSLLLAVVAVHGGDPRLYTPQITSSSNGGRITATTFTLETPNCAFSGNATDTIYLLVSYNNNSTTVPYGTITTTTTAETLSYSSLESQRYYIALNTTGNDYNCPRPNNKLSLLRIGNDASCAQDPSVAFCNGPLPPGASFRVMFIVLNSGGQTHTKWSDVITLNSVKDPSTIDTWIGRRSGGMIVITTILSVLLAILLACLIAALAVGTKDICWRKKLENKPYEDPDINKLKRYTFHHAPEPPPFRI